MQVQSYLFFDGRCEEALDFYKTAIGAEVQMLMRFKDSPEPPQGDGCGAPGVAPDKVMHASFKVGDTEVMCSDGMAMGKLEFKGISLALSTKSEAEAERLFANLLEGGHVQMPLARTFFSPKFGMLADRFGVSWMIMAEA